MRVAKTAKLDPDVFKYLALWEADLNSRKWATFSRLENSEAFVFVFHSSWQAEKCRVFGRQMITRVVTTQDLLDGQVHCTHPAGR